jgi:lipid-binding SYLF domain-containing protein
MFTKLHKSCLCVAVVAALAACSTAPTTAEERSTLNDQSRQAINDVRSKDPRVQHYLDTAYAYAVFPTIGQAGAGVGGAYGHGEVFRNGQMIGYCNVTQATIGPQLGGQSLAEIIFFENRAAFDAFANNQFAFDAQANAVAADAGASAAANYQRGVLVFTQAGGGLMAQAAVGGQKFTYENLNNTPMTAGDEP